MSSALGAASLYSLTIPLKGSISLVDTLVMATIFFVYIYGVSRAHSEEPEFRRPRSLARRPAQGAAPRCERRAVRLRRGRHRRLRRALRRGPRRLRRRARHRRVPARAVARPARLRGARVPRRRNPRVPRPHHRRHGDAAVLEGQPVDAAARQPVDRLQPLRRHPRRPPARRPGAPGSLPHRRAVRCSRSPCS